MNDERALLVCIDGVAPRFVTPAVMPNLVSLARSGASCFTARRAGLRTAAVHPWRPLDSVLDKGATDRRVVIGDGSDPADDDAVADEARSMLAAGVGLAFVSFGGPDLAGHAAGWVSPDDVGQLTAADARLGRVLAATTPEHHVVVTADHGGTGTDHETFVVARSPRITPGSGWATASMLDIAPTVADLLGLRPDPAWEGRSLVGAEEPLVDVLLALLEAGTQVTYGERVTMLDHALQTAAVAMADGADDAGVVAALLHDVGHVLGDAGVWGLPTHADVGARALQPLLDAAVVEPIRLHVEAKRWLVSTDPSYAARLSEASVATLAEQGGPLAAGDVATFAAAPGADAAVRLRRWDDAGKVVGLAIPDLESHRPRLERALRPAAPPSAAWLRDACRCPSCRNAVNDQHLLDIGDVIGWRLVAWWWEGDTLMADVEHPEAGLHRCVIPPRPADLQRSSWGASHADRLLADAADWRAAWEDRVAEAVARDGIALVRNVPTEPGTVLAAADRLGFVRATNYGALFDVIARPDPENLADTAVALPLHTDNPYRDPQPTVQLLLCLESAGTGGASRFSDGVAAAERLRRTDPDAFTVLAGTMVTFRYHGDGGDLRATRPLVDAAPDGTVRGVAVNHRSMEAPELDPAGADAFYAAYAAFAAEIDRATVVAELTLEPGDLVVFDNRRVLHGRTAFEVTGPRHLQGCYIDIDAILSRVRAG